MEIHRFKVGQTVRFSAGAVNKGVSGLYRVVALLPEERGDRQYRVQASPGTQQRVVWESQLSRVDLS